MWLRFSAFLSSWGIFSEASTAMLKAKGCQHLALIQNPCDNCSSFRRWIKNFNLMHYNLTTVKTQKQAVFSYNVFTRGILWKPPDIFHQETFYKKGLQKNFVKSTGKYLRQSHCYQDRTPQQVNTCKRLIPNVDLPLPYY